MQYIIDHISKREKERKTHLLVSKYIEKLHVETAFSDKTYYEINARISSKVAQCEISIRDHQKLLKP